MRKNKNIMIAFLLVALFMIFKNLISFQVSALAINNLIELSQIDLGILNINHNDDKQLAIIVEKDNYKEQYVLNVKNIKSIPLQLGNGKYKLTVLEQVENTKFKIIEKKEIEANSIKNNQVFLQSINMIDFEYDMEAIKAAKELTKNAKTNEEKIKIIHQYVAKNIKYDEEKAKKPPVNYVPTLNETYKTNKGICYDYASLTAGMLRSLGIPTKLMKGYNINIKEYHAWNEVLVNDEWKIIDTTYDAAYIKIDKKVEMYKPVTDYKATGVY